MNESAAFIDAGDAGRAEDPDSADRPANIAFGAGGSVCVLGALAHNNQ
jgi:hypothetical protein